MGHGYTFWTVVMVLATIKADSTEEQLPYTYSFYAPSSMKFNDLFTNNIHTVNENTEMNTEPSTIMPDDNFDIIKVPTHFVEFYPELTTVHTTIKPRYILNSTFLKRMNKKRTKSTTTTEDPEAEGRDVIPIRKDYQRGVLDLLLPTPRVKSFKSIFDFFRRLMSHTFR